MDWAALEFWFEEALFLYIAFTLGLKALLLRRETRLGQSLALNNAAFALGYVGAFLAAWIDWFGSHGWQWPIRATVAITTTAVLWQFRRTFGGWRATLREAFRSFRREPPRDREGY